MNCCVSISLALLFAGSVLGAVDVESSGAQQPARAVQVRLAAPQWNTSNSVLRGTVTFHDATRNLLVLQDGDSAWAISLDSDIGTFSAGDRIEVEGKFTPFIPALPEFPNAPSGTQVRSSFEGPSDWGDDYLSRTRALLRPPVSGEYTFWIASDDSSELWLSGNESPNGARRIALVPTGRWTEPRQWTRHNSQQSRRIHLEAGKAYYIEALGQEMNGRDCLAVAWQGPGIKQAIIGDNYLSVIGTAERQGQPGVLWEYWTNFFSTDLSVLRVSDERVLRCAGGRMLSRARGTLPQPLVIGPGDSFESKAAYRVVLVDGRVEFASSTADGISMELRHGNSRIIAKTPPGIVLPGIIPNGSLVRVKGVCEPPNNPSAEDWSGTIWVHSANDIEWLQSEDNWSLVEVLPQYQLTRENMDLPAGRVIHVQGRVAGMAGTNAWRLDGKDIFSGYASSNGVDWLSLGTPVEVEMGDTALAGFAIASHRAEELALAEFDNIAGLGNSWSGANLGQPAIAGGFEWRGNVLTVRGSGADIWFQSDNGYLAYQPVRGDVDIVARLAELKSPDPGAKTVMMIRDSLESNSQWAGIAMLPGDRVGLQSRREKGINTVGGLAVRPARWIKLSRRQKTFLVQTADRSLRAGQRLDVLGAVQWNGDEAMLADVRVRVLPSGAARQPSSAAEIRNVPIGQLAAESEAAQNTPYGVRLRVRAVVTVHSFLDGEWVTFVQDPSGAMRVRWRSETPRGPIAAGDLVELNLSPLAPGAEAELVAGLAGRFGSTEMPEPIRLTSEMPGRIASDPVWTEVEGVVQSATSDGRLWLNGIFGRLPVRAAYPGADVLTNKVDALVRIRGVLSREPSPILFLPAARFVEVVEEPRKDPFSGPGFSVRAIQESQNRTNVLRRVKVSGVVTSLRGNFIVVQDETGGIMVEAANPPHFAPGERVEAAGFPTRRESGIWLATALVRSIRGPETVAPLKLAAGHLTQPRNSGMLVSVDAVLLAHHYGQGVHTLDMQAGQRAFRASLMAENRALPRIPAGSRLRLTGVSVLEQLEGPSAGLKINSSPLIASMELLLRSPADIVVVERPPWWNWRHTAASISVAAIVFVAAVLWIRTLRRHVEERTRQLRETMGKLQKETQISATLSERDRLAGEIHDSLEQGLSAIMMQMDAAAKLVHNPEEVGRYLAMAKNMAGFSRTEVQHAVWDMQSPLLENADLATALRRVASDISAGETPRVSVEVSGTVCPLPSTVEHHLLRIGQEAITNAVKHGNPQHIWLSLEYGPGAVRFTVRDDGAGFDPAAASSFGGHFGLQGIRTRARKMDAELSIRSKPGEGTCIEVAVPCRD